jgi:hypothetical protein
LQQFQAEAADTGDSEIAKAYLGSYRKDPTMRTTFARYLVVILLSATGASAQEGTILHMKRPVIGKGKTVQLKEPVIGCENKADLKDFPHVLPETISPSEMPLPYREGHCIRLAPGQLRITQVQGTYACLRSAGHSCLWVRSEDVGAPIVGDFPTPEQEDRLLAPPERGRPEFTPLR